MMRSILAALILITGPIVSEAAATIARHVYSGQCLKKAAEMVEDGAYFMDAAVRLDPDNIAPQGEWYKT